MKKRYYRFNDRQVVYTQVEDRGVLHHTVQNTYESLNETYNRIVNAVMGGKSNSDMVVDLLQEYDITQIICEEEVDQALNTLCNKGYIFEVDEV